MFRTIITRLTQTDRQNNDETIRIKKIRLWDIAGAAIGAVIVCGGLYWLAMAVLR